LKLELHIYYVWNQICYYPVLIISLRSDILFTNQLPKRTVESKLDKEGKEYRGQQLNHHDALSLGIAKEGIQVAEPCVG